MRICSCWILLNTNGLAYYSRLLNSCYSHLRFLFKHSIKFEMRLDFSSSSLRLTMTFMAFSSSGEDKEKMVMRFLIKKALSFR